MAEFTCQTCGARFDLHQQVLDRYPGWTPRLCRSCRDSGGASQARPAGRPDRVMRRRGPRRNATDNLTLDEVMARYSDGPQSGVFTDGSSVPNPGPGGWGAVYVIDGALIDQAHGHDADTTNNRMELTALIAGCRLVPDGVASTVYSDSRLAVQTLTEWAPGWERRGWKRKTGPIKNLDLVQEAFSLTESRPELTIAWIEAHAGNRWNEYADSLANAWRRDTL